jgi:hypothetical protein
MISSWIRRFSGENNNLVASSSNSILSSGCCFSPNFFADNVPRPFPLFSDLKVFLL